MIVTELPERLKSVISEAHQNVYVDYYPKIRKSLKIPAVLIELSELRGGDQIGTEQLPMTAYLEARCVWAPENEGLARVRELAASVAYSIFRAARLGLPISPPNITNISPDALKPELDQFDVWVVEWTYDIFIGENLWLENVLPREITLGPTPHRLVVPAPPGELIPDKVFSDASPDVAPSDVDDYEDLV
jgi:hypothetical protein